MSVTTQNKHGQFKVDFQSIPVLLLLLVCGLAPCLNLNAAVLSINGLATYNNLSKDYYVAALYLSEPESDAQKILNSKQHKQMKLLVTANRWSPRAWTKQWQDNIAINNELPHEALQEKLGSFTTILKGNLLAGDLILIDYESSLGTQVFINQQRVLVSSDMALFNALLATWIGNLPPSRNFKNRILSLAIDKQAIADTQNLYRTQVSEKRINDIKLWLFTPEQLIKIEAEKRQKAQRLLFIKAQQQALKETQKLALAAEKLALAAEKVALEAQAQHRIKIKKEQAKQLLMAQQQRQAQQIANTLKREKQMAYAKLKNDKESKLENSYYKNLYIWQLQTAIRDKISYPAWAREFNQEAIIDVSFTINSKGKVIEIEADEDKAPKLLIGEVVKSIESTSGKITPPKKLKGSSWKVSVNHSFNLRSKIQTILEQPKKPHHLL